jgi:hypothetical protein
MGNELWVCALPFETDPVNDFLFDSLLLGSSNARIFAMEAALIDVNRAYQTAI